LIRGAILLAAAAASPENIEPSTRCPVVLLAVALECLFSLYGWALTQVAHCASVGSFAPGGRVEKWAGAAAGFGFGEADAPGLAEAEALAEADGEASAVPSGSAEALDVLGAAVGAFASAVPQPEAAPPARRMNTATQGTTARIAPEPYSRSQRTATASRARSR
jgi:hypothetical protein